MVINLGTYFPFVAVGPELAELVGQREGGTRVYRREGSSDDFREWLRALFAHVPGGLMSPGSAARFAGVSRAGLHKAMREGRLTVFAFLEVEPPRGVFGERERRQNPHLYVPVSECEAWLETLKRRATRFSGEDMRRAESAGEVSIQSTGGDRPGDSDEGEGSDWRMW